MHFSYIILSLNLSKWYCRHSNFTIKTCNLLCNCGSLYESSLCLCLSCFILFLMLYGQIWYRPYASFLLCMVAMRCFCVPRLCLGLPLPCGPGSGVCGTLTSALGLCPVPNGIKGGRKKDGETGGEGQAIVGDEWSRALAALVWGNQALGRLTRAAGGTVGMGTGRLAHHEMRARVHPSHSNQDEGRPTIRVKKGIPWFNFHSPERVFSKLCYSLTWKNATRLQIINSLWRCRNFSVSHCKTTELSSVRWTIVTYDSEIGVCKSVCQFVSHVTHVFVESEGFPHLLFQLLNKFLFT